MTVKMDCDIAIQADILNNNNNIKINKSLIVLIIDLFH